MRLSVWEGIETGLAMHFSRKLRWAEPTGVCGLQARLRHRFFDNLSDDDLIEHVSSVRASRAKNLFARHRSIWEVGVQIVSFDLCTFQLEASVKLGHLEELHGCGSGIKSTYESVL